MMKFILLVIVFIFSGIVIRAQSGSAFEASDIYIHLDKTVYVNNENIWFTGYFLNNAFDTADRHTLYVVLTDPVRRKIVATDRFVMTNGVSAGNLFLSDSVKPGEYSFVAYTNAFLHGCPERPFAGSITVRSSAPQSRGVFTADGAPAVDGAAADTLVRLSYFPEGGSLIQDHICKMEMQITGNRARVYHGVLFSDKDSVSGFETDGSGRCMILFKPKPDGHYHVQLDSLDPNVRIVQTFPRVLPSGYSLHLISPVRDTLRLSIRSSDEKSTCFLRVQKGTLPIYSAKMEFSGEGTLVSVDARNWPPGIATLFLLDKDSVLAASRDIYIPEAGVHCSIVLDSTAYHLRSKVKVHLHITDSGGKGVKASFSLAAVYARRLDPLRFIDRQISDALPEISNALLINNWERSNAQRPILGEEDDFGRVLRNGKRLKRPEQIFLTGADIGMISTDSSGSFELPHRLLKARPDARINLSLVGKESDKYSIVLTNNYDAVNKELASSVMPVAFITRNNAAGDNVSSESEDGLLSQNHVKTLQTVTVKAHQRPDFGEKARNRFGPGEFHSKTCTDWVCMNNILNCPNHHTMERPIEGYYYLYHDKNQGQPVYVIYHGCKDPPAYNPPPVVAKANAIHLSKEFNAADYQKWNPEEPETSTTLFWSPFHTSDENGDLDLSFYTNDISGKFTIVLEGITESGALSGRTNFFVQP